MDAISSKSFWKNEESEKQKKVIMVCELSVASSDSDASSRANVIKLFYIYSSYIERSHLWKSIKS